MCDRAERLAVLQAAAYAAGADYSGVFDPKKLIFREEVRAMCAADRCRQYGRS